MSTFDRRSKVVQTTNYTHSSRYGVVAGATPGVAAHDTPDGKGQTLDGAMLLQCLLGILAAGRSETAGRRRIGRYAGLIENNGQTQQPRQTLRQLMEQLLHNFSDNRVNRFFIRSSTTAVGRISSDCQMKARKSCEWCVERGEW